MFGLVVLFGIKDLIHIQNSLGSLFSMAANLFNLSSFSYLSARYLILLYLFRHVINYILLLLSFLLI